MHECKSCGATWEKGDICPYCRRHIIIENPPFKPEDTHSEKRNRNISVKKILMCIFGTVMLTNLIRYSVYSITDNLYSVSSSEIHHKEHNYTSKKSVSYNSDYEKSKNLEYQREKGIYVDKNYEVGKDIPEGEYIICSDGLTPYKDFYMGIYTSDSYSDASQISGNWYNGNIIAVLEKGQFIEVSHGTIYDREKSGITLDPFSDSGMFHIGVDIPAGDYTIISDEECTASYKIYSSLNTVAPVVKESGYLDGEEAISIKLEDGEYIQTKFCHIKKNS